MNIQLTPELERLLQKKMRACGYNSASEVVREALRLMEERDRFIDLRKEEIRKQITRGLKSLRMGKSVDGKAVFARIEGELDRLERNGRK